MENKFPNAAKKETPFNEESASFDNMNVSVLNP